MKIEIKLKTKNQDCFIFLDKHAIYHNRGIFVEIGTFIDEYISNFGVFVYDRNKKLLKRLINAHIVNSKNKTPFGYYGKEDFKFVYNKG